MATLLNDLLVVVGGAGWCGENFPRSAIRQKGFPRDAGKSGQENRKSRQLSLDRVPNFYDQRE